MRGRGSREAVMDSRVGPPIDRGPRRCRDRAGRRATGRPRAVRSGVDSPAAGTGSAGQAPNQSTPFRIFRLAEAQTAFDDPLGAYYPDALYPERFVLIGFSRVQRLLYVVYAEVEVDAIRIISARKATKHEKARYESD